MYSLQALATHWATCSGDGHSGGQGPFTGWPATPSELFATPWPPLQGVAKCTLATFSEFAQPNRYFFLNDKTFTIELYLFNKKIWKFPNPL